MTRFGIIGAGHIAERLVTAMNYLRKEGIEPYAIASRNAAKAAEFAEKNGCEKSFDSYEKLVSDPNVDVVYVATPNTFHFAHSMLALEHGKHVLCEKPFTVNVEETEILFAEAKKRNLFICEALWTRFLPVTAKIRDIIASGEIGEVRTVTGAFGRMLSHVPRIALPELAGGGLLDLGIYPLNFAMMFLGEDFTSMKSLMTLTPEGVDAQTIIILEYADGRIANVMSSIVSFMNEPGAICGTKGRIFMDSLLRSTEFTVESSTKECRKVECGVDCNGYEYQLRSVSRAISEGRLECPEMPWDATRKVMRIMDVARRNGGVTPPA